MCWNWPAGNRQLVEPLAVQGLVEGDFMLEPWCSAITNEGVHHCHPARLDHRRHAVALERRRRFPAQELFDKGREGRKTFEQLSPKMQARVKAMAGESGVLCKAPLSRFWECVWPPRGTSRCGQPWALRSKRTGTLCSTALCPRRLPSKAAEDRIREQGGDPDTEFWCIDVDSSETFCTFRKDVCPCLTRGRGVHGHFITRASHRGMMTMNEIIRLMGFDVDRLRGWQNVASRTTMGHAMGDAMHLTVLKKVLAHLCASAGLTPPLDTPSSSATT